MKTPRLTLPIARLDEDGLHPVNETRDKPAGHEITRKERRQIDMEMAALSPPPARTAHVVRGDLAAAEVVLAEWNKRFGDYGGNNPRKFQKDIRRAAARVEALRAEVAS